jgi:hypothetical protein
MSAGAPSECPGKSRLTAHPLPAQSNRQRSGPAEEADQTGQVLRISTFLSKNGKIQMGAAIRKLIDE